MAECCCGSIRKIVGALGTLIPEVVDEALSTLTACPEVACLKVVSAISNVICQHIRVSECLYALMFYCGIDGMIEAGYLIVDTPELIDYISTDECMKQLMVIRLLLTNLQTSRSLPPSSTCLPRLRPPFRSI